MEVNLDNSWEWNSNDSGDDLDTFFFPLKFRKYETQEAKIKISGFVRKEQHLAPIGRCSLVWQSFLRIIFCQLEALQQQKTPATLEMKPNIAGPLT